MLQHYFKKMFYSCGFVWFQIHQIIIEKIGSVCVTLIESKFQNILYILHISFEMIRKKKILTDSKCFKNVPGHLKFTTIFDLSNVPDKDTCPYLDEWKMHPPNIELQNQGWCLFKHFNRFVLHKISMHSYFFYSCPESTCTANKRIT